jgi:hypothetical protein
MALIVVARRALAVDHVPSGNHHASSVAEPRRSAAHHFAALHHQPRSARTGAGGIITAVVPSWHATASMGDSTGALPWLF